MSRTQITQSRLTATRTQNTTPRFLVRNFGSNGAASNINYVVVQDAPSLKITGNMTITAWIYPFTMPNGNILNKLALIEGYSLQTRTTRVLRLEVNNIGGASFVNSNSILQTKVWQHVAVSYNLQNAYFYVNGVLQGSPAFSQVPEVGTVNLGLGANASGGTPFQGFMDDVRIYNTNLGLSQIQEIYYQGTEPCSCCLVGKWLFNEGTGTVVSDSSPYNNVGTYTGGGIYWYQGNNIMSARLSA